MIDLLSEQAITYLVDDFDHCVEADKRAHFHRQYCGSYEQRLVTDSWFNIQYKLDETYSMGVLPVHVGTMSF